MELIDIPCLLNVFRVYRWFLVFAKIVDTPKHKGFFQQKVCEEVNTQN